MGTGESLTASARVPRLQTALHAKAKGAPGFRFYSLSDKVWREDVLAVAWQAVRRNSGAAGVDGETVADVESTGVDRWLGALARDLNRSICRRVSELTTPRHLLLPPEVVVARLNRVMTGWANYFTPGQVSPAYAAIDEHATRRLRQWLCRKHKVRTGIVRFPNERLRKGVRAHAPCQADGELSVGEGMISSESRMREIRMSGSTSGDWKRSHGEE